MVRRWRGKRKLFTRNRIGIGIGKGIGMRVGKGIRIERSDEFLRRIRMNEFPS